MTPQCDAQYDAFLCHNSKDEVEVKQIEQQLQAQGIRTFLDVSKILGGDDWTDTILDAISKCWIHNEKPLKLIKALEISSLYSYPNTAWLERLFSLTF